MAEDALPARSRALRADFAARAPLRLRQKFLTTPLPQRATVGGKVTARGLSPTGQQPVNVSPMNFPGADPTGRADSTSALQAALAVCVNASTVTTRDFPAGMVDGAGCTVDLEGGEYLTTQPLIIPSFIANMEISGGSIVAMQGFPSDGYLIQVGGTEPCKTHQGSCNVDIGFPNLFLDGNRIAAGLLNINSVMGTTVGPHFYGLNFTTLGIAVNGGHEVMIVESWLGEFNFDHNYSSAGPPKATAIGIYSNDHYISDSIVFSSLVGLDMRGAANNIGGLHVWFPWNVAANFGATAFSVTGGQNRFDGCYVDCSRAVFNIASGEIIWTNGFFLGGSPAVELHGSTTSFQLVKNEFHGGGGNAFAVFPASGKQYTLTDTRIEDNIFAGRQGQASRASQSLTQTTPTTSWQFSFCDQLIVPTISSVRVSLQAASGFPVAVARPPTGCNVTVETSVATAGTMTVDVDSSTYSSKCALC